MPNSKSQPSSQKAYMGAATGLIVGIFLQPLEIIKTNLIINPTSNPLLSRAGVLSGLYYGSKEIYNHEGVRGFARGMTPAMLRIIISTSIFFSFLDKTSKKLKQSSFSQQGFISQTSINFLSSGIARIFSGVLTNPITVIRTRLEVLGFYKYVNMRHAIRMIYKDEGMKGFGVGALTSAIKDAPFAGVYFVIYVKTKRFLENTAGIASLLVNSLASGLLAGVVATGITNPFDVIRTRLQYGFFIKEEEYRYGGMRDGFRKIYAKEGIGGFFKGLAPRLIRKPASNALTFVVFESLHKTWNKSAAF